MTSPDSDGANPKLIRSSVDVAVHLVVIGLLVLACYRIFRPFVIPTLWGVILGVALYPFYAKFVRALGGNSKLAGLLFSVITIGAIVYPTYRLSDSFIGSVAGLAEQIDQGTLEVPPPNESVREWPLVGDRVYDFWNQASTNLSATLERAQPKLREAGLKVLGLIASLGLGILQTIIAILIAVYAMSNAERGRQRSRALFGRLGGEKGAQLADMSTATIRSVAQGVVGIALIQATLAGIGLAVMGVPGWGVWTVVVLMLAVVQLPPWIILLPIIIQQFSAHGATTGTIVFAVYQMVVSFADMFLKPLLLGRGLEIPMPVILIGAIGGVMLWGIIGLFVGAVVFAIGYQLFGTWMEFVEPVVLDDDGDYLSGGGDVDDGAPA